MTSLKLTPPRNTIVQYTAQYAPAQEQEAAGAAATWSGVLL